MNEINKEELLDAIDDYDVLTKKHLAVLKILIQLAEGNVANITIKHLAELSKVSKPVVYQALSVLEKREVIEREKITIGKLSKFILKPEGLEEIIRYSNKLNSLKNKN